jgi:hypothetical protein
MPDIKKEQANRLRFLERLYELTEGDLGKTLGTTDIASDLELNSDEMLRAVQYLRDSGLVWVKNLYGPISLTRLGLDQIEKVHSRPDKPTSFLPALNLIINSGNFQNSSLQQVTSSSTQNQSVTINANMKEQILEVLAEIKKSANSLGLDNQDKEDLVGNIETVEAQAKISKANPEITKSSLGSIRDIIGKVSKGAIEKAGATVLVEKVPSWLAYLNDFIQNI